MKIITLLLLVGVSIGTSACTTTGSSGYYVSSIPQRIEIQRPYRPYYNSYNYCDESPVPVVGPQYYKTRVPYVRPGGIKNYTGTPIVAPKAWNPSSNMIIPNSWN